MLLGRRWRSIIPPIHLQYFTERSFREFLRRVGFEPVFLGVFPTLASPNITFGMRNSIRRLMTRLDNPLIRIFGLNIINFLVWIKRYIVYRPLGFFLVKIKRFGKGIFFVAKPIGD